MSDLPGEDRLARAMDVTWAPAETIEVGQWTLRCGKGGGKRVSAATTDSPVSDESIKTAESAMLDVGQPALFMLRNHNADLDKRLADLGYRVVDPVLIFTAPIDVVARIDPKPLTAIPGEQPLAIMCEIWARGGIGPARIDVMERTIGPKTYLFSRHDVDKPGGCAFVALDDEIAMLHALEVVPDARRSGVARNLLGRAAIWGMENGAKFISVVTTGGNLPAQKLFSSLGMQVVGKYHYRMK
ncbi:MAG: GNAT family N-acetyltransferase [Rhodobacterales bacterium]|jgi:N-acetylglutamate synthase|nr:GNAT family N-acetyltransferase [Rhodobacter sp.]HBN32635.1 GNAT family N-acetyltransferase [Paracoccaceae bacterium]